jgi:hypothetical protein
MVIVTACGLVDSISYKVKIFLFSVKPKLSMEPNQPPIQRYRGLFPLGVKRQGHEANHTPTSSVEVKNNGAIASLPKRRHSVVLN